jgi:hypothetical protein
VTMATINPLNANSGMKNQVPLHRETI